MATSNLSRDSFEYLDEKSVASDLICSICQEICTNPQLTPCDHIFCHSCITRCIGTLRAPCPNCRARLSMVSLKPANSLIVNMINQLAVRCMKCGRKDLKRDQIDDHIHSECPETIIRCRSSGGTCSWQGQISELNKHLQLCMADRLNPLTNAIMDEHRSLKRTLTETEATYARDENELSSFIRDHETQVAIESNSRTQTLQTTGMNREICQRDIDNAIDDLRTCEREVKKMKIDSLQYQLSTKYLKEKFKKESILTDYLSDQEQLLEILLVGNRCVVLNKELMQQPVESVIDISERYLVDSDMTIIVEHIVRDRKCKILTLDRNFITGQGISILISVWQRYSQLENVSLACNSIGDTGVQHLSSILSLENCCLTKLNLDSNAITDSGAKAMAEALKINRSLQHLSIAKNRINDDGMISLAISITNSNKTLKQLYLHDNRLIQTSSVYSFVAMIQRHPCLEFLNLTGCCISEMDQFRLQQTVKHKTNFSLCVS